MYGAVAAADTQQASQVAHRLCTIVTEAISGYSRGGQQLADIVAAI